MKYNKLGNTEIKISEIGIGTMSLSAEQQAEGNEVITEAFEQGINFFDTADLYEKGMNEVLVGRAIGSFRDRIILSTKVGNKWRADGSGWDWKASKPYIIQQIEDSLTRLSTSYIDLYQLHGGMIDDPIDEIIEAFESLKKQGKIRAYGISSIRMNVIKAYSERSDISSVMMQYSLLDRRAEEIFGFLQDKSISVLARGALAQGQLLGKPAKKDYLIYTAGEVHNLYASIERLSKQEGISAEEIALGWVVNNPSIASAVVGARTPEQLRRVLVESNTAVDYSKLTDRLKPIRYTEHRD